MLTPTGRVEAMEKRLDATLGAVKTVQPPLAKFYNSLSDEQKARFNSLRSASRPTGDRAAPHLLRAGTSTSPTASGLTFRRFSSANNKCLFNSFLKVRNKLLVA